MFDSAGSNIDTVVTLLSDCDGGELACNNTAPGGMPQALAVAEVVGGETYWVAVEGNNGETGSIDLSIAPVECPSGDLTGLSLPATVSSVGGTTTHEPRCTNDDLTSQPEKTLRYVPDSAGLYRFTAVSDDSVGTVLSVYDGAMCGGEYQQCNWNVGGSTAYPAEVTRYLEADQAVTIVVEGSTGVAAFDVDIELLDSSSDSCDNIPDLGASQSSTVASTDPHLVSSSCGWAGNSVGAWPQHLYQFTVNVSAGNFCDVYLDEESSTAITTYVIEGDPCRGTEFMCDSPDNAYTFGQSDNGVYTLVVENVNSFHGDADYTIINNCD